MAPDTATTPTGSDRNDWLRWMRAAADEFTLDIAAERDRFARAICVRSQGTKVADLRKALQAIGHRGAATTRGGVCIQLSQWWHILPADQKIPADETATDDQRAELAMAISDQAEAIAAGTVIGPVYAAVARLSANVAQLAAWTPDDRA